MGVVLEKGNNEKLDWIVGASLGGLFQCFAYTLFKIPLFTPKQSPLRLYLDFSTNDYGSNYLCDRCECFGKI